MPKRQATAPFETDVIVNRSLLAYAELRRTVQSWSGQAGLANGDTKEANNDDLEEDLSVPESETTGVGYVSRESGTATGGTTPRHALSTNDKLRKQLLGRRAKEAGKRSVEREGGLNASKPRPKTIVYGAVTEEDEGRSSLGRKRKKAAEVDYEIGRPSMFFEVGNGEAEQQTSDKNANVPPPNGKPRSYLDEVLAGRGKKKKRKKSVQAPNGKPADP